MDLMDLSRFLDVVRHSGWQGMALWGVLLAQAVLWVGLVRLQLAIRRDVIQSRHQLAAGKVATGTENDDGAGLRTRARRLVFSERIGRFQIFRGK